MSRAKKFPKPKPKFRRGDRVQYDNAVLTVMERYYNQWGLYEYRLSNDRWYWEDMLELEDEFTTIVQRIRRKAGIAE